MFIEIVSCAVLLRNYLKIIAHKCLERFMR